MKIVVGPALARGLLFEGPSRVCGGAAVLASLRMIDEFRAAPSRDREFDPI
jgi:hypothetical protein